MTTTSISISPVVALEEERAMTASLRNRNLILAQSVADLKQHVADLLEQIAALSAPKEEPA
jgi:hypothetical protein